METLNPASSFLGNPNSNWLLLPQSNNTKWTKEENKSFESALAMFDEETPDRWLMVASMIPGKSVSEVIDQYQELVTDVNYIEAGLVPAPPSYQSPSFNFEFMENHGFETCRKRGSSRSCDQERKKGIPWTEEEHRRFLMGLQAHGKGDWRNISRNFVITKTPTQVASHAQKYFLRQISGGKDKKRPSIHDITTVNLLRGKPLSDESKPLESTYSPKGLFEWNNSISDGISMDFEFDGNKAFSF